MVSKIPMAGKLRIWYAVYNFIRKQHDHDMYKKLTRYDFIKDYHICTDNIIAIFQVSDISSYCPLESQ